MEIKEKGDQSMYEKGDHSLSEKGGQSSADDLKALTSTPDLGPKETRRIMRNICVMSIAFMVHFTAFQGAGNLQSSINAGLGTASLATIYGALIVSNLFLPVVVIRWLGCKWAMALSFIAYMPYIGAQFYPAYYTLIPAGLFVGFGGGPLWCAKCTYLSVVAEKYQKLTGISSEVLTVRFFGIFFMFFQFAQVWGNLISSLVLGTGDSSNSTAPEVDVREVCGARFCPTLGASDDNSTNSNLDRPDDTKIYIIAGIYLGCMVAAVLIVAFGVDSLSRYGEGVREGSGKGLTGIKLLVITMKLVKERNQLLLLPMTVWMGVGQAFMGADFTSNFVSCAWGIQYIGFVMICYGLCNSASAVGAGWLVKFLGRLPVVCAAFALQLAVLFTMLFWRPHPDEFGVFFALSGLWGVCDGVWLVQINALCGILFPGREEAAYSNFRLWESLGFIIAYAYSPYLCTYIKLYIVIGLLVVGMGGYLTIEVAELKKAKKQAIHKS